jgi:energy-coupling factor transporter transmembrane protein EcfT
VGLLLLAGLTVEMVLFSFQLFVAETFCLYCLFIVAVIVFLNILYGKKQIVSGLIVAGAVLIGFALVNFKTAQPSANFTLEEGVFGSRTCAAPTKKLYLIFSDDCPHCLEVIAALEECNSCDLHLNPIDTVEGLEFEGIVKRERFSPQVNRQILTVLGIDKIPVLLVEHSDGFQFIQGEQRIIEYVRHACFQTEPTLYLNRSRYPDKEQISAFSEDEGECSITVDCDEPGTSAPVK